MPCPGSCTFRWCLAASNGKPRDRMRAEREWAAHALRLLDREDINRVILACSGGGDSLALLWLCARDWRLRRRVGAVVVVDHGLRVAAVRESARVMGAAARAGFAGQVCRVLVEAGSGLQARARAARFDALEEAARARGASAILLGHTRDDLAETLLDRFLAGRGARALDAMRPVARAASQCARVRPLLAATRAELRAYLAALGEGYVDDPSNDDACYQRVRLRRWLSDLDSATRARFLEVAPLLQQEGAAVKALVADAGVRLGNGAARHNPPAPTAVAASSVMARLARDEGARPLLAVVGWVEAVLRSPLAMSQIGEVARVRDCGHGEVWLVTGVSLHLEDGEWFVARRPTGRGV